MYFIKTNILACKINKNHVFMNEKHFILASKKLKFKT
jgi:hypothetical protein